MHAIVKAFLVSSGVACFGFNSASAADIPYRQRTPAYKSAPVPAYYNWTGFYVGGNVGYGWTRGDGTATIAGVSVPFSGSGRGFFGGVQAGYNWQFGSFVTGVEADIQASGGRGDVTGFVGPVGVTATAKTPWFGTFRGRLGYAFDRTLIYATGGALYGRATLEGTLSTTGPFSTGTDYWAWTVGGGLEYAFTTNWSTKLEYLYVGSPSKVPVPPGTTVTGDARSHLVRVGLNYKFGGPVFSRY